MKRIRTADGAPIASRDLNRTGSLSCHRPIWSRIRFTKRWTARGFLPQRAIQRMRSRAASAEDAQHLHCEPGAPLLMTERRCFLGDGQIVEYCETRYKGDVYDFVFELTAMIPVINWL